MKEQTTKPVNDPKYQQVIEAIRELQDGATVNGTKMPFRINMSTLSESTGIYRQTISKYIVNMVNDEILTKIGNKYILNNAANLDELDNHQFINSSSHPDDSDELMNSSINKSSEYKDFDDLSNPQINKSSNDNRKIDDCNIPAQSPANIPRNRKREQKEQPVKVAERPSKEEVYKLNRLLLVIRTILTKKDFELEFHKPLKEVAGRTKTEMIREFIWETGKTQLTASTDPYIYEALIDLLSVIICERCGDDLGDGEGNDTEKLMRGYYDPDNQPKTLQQSIDESGIMNVQIYHDFDDDDDDNEDEDNVDDTEDENDEEDEEEFDNRDGWAERGRAGRESPNHKLITRPRNVCFVEFTPDEIDGIVNGDFEAEVHESPAKMFVNYVWNTLYDIYEANFNGERSEDSDNQSNGKFSLEHTPIFADDLKTAINCAYADVKDLWKEGGYVDLEDENGEITPHEIDWSDKPMFDILEAEKVFRWERMKDADGETMFIASKSHIFNLEDTVPKPVRPERKIKDPVYQAYHKQNVEYITRLLEADEKEPEKLNALERIIVGFIKKYYDIGESSLHPGCVKLIVPEKGMKDGEQLLDPSGNYLHHSGLNKLYQQLTDIRISPQEFQMCLQFPVADNSYHSYLKVVSNMFWAQGIAYICAQKGLISHFAPSNV